MLTLSKIAGAFLFIFIYFYLGEDGLTGQAQLPAGACNDYSVSNPIIHNFLERNYGDKVEIIKTPDGGTKKVKVGGLQIPYVRPDWKPELQDAFEVNIFYSYGSS